MKYLWKHEMQLYKDCQAIMNNMKYIIYQGNPRTESKARKIVEVTTLNEALDRMALERLKGREAYVKEIPVQKEGEIS